jgi:cellulose 1,4-beta-cellobiosidase
MRSQFLHRPRWLPAGRFRRWVAILAALVLGGGLAVAVATPAVAATSCSVGYVTQNEWAGGFVAQITITNSGSSAINGWTLGFAFAGDQKITNAWNATVSQTGANVTATGAAYNATIAPGGNASLGFQGTWNSSDAVPTAFSVNGAACGGGTQTPGIVATPSTVSVTQGTTGTVGLALSAAPAANVTVTVARASGNTGLSVGSGGSLTFTSANWSTQQNVTIQADSSGTGAATFTAAATGYTSASFTATETAGGCGTSCGGRVANPYVGANTYLNPDYVKSVTAQAQADGNSAAEAAVAKYQTAIWMDHIGAIAGDGGKLGLQAQLDNALAARQGSTPELVEVVVYDLPGRDCAALASNGEIPATQAGLTQYEGQYIDPIATIVGNAKYAGLRIVAIIEPDSLPNVVTNQSKSACATATPFYEQGITYALNKLHAIPNVYNYLDIAHSGWLGWPSNLNATPAVYKQVVTSTTAGYASIDGFISDTANYTPVQEPFLPNPTLSVGGQPLDSANFYQYNPTFDELTYDTQMYNALVSAGFPGSDKFLIDTSRDGWGGPDRPTSLNSSPTTVTTYVAANKIDQRPFRGDWCNQNNAGIGARPQAQPFGAGSPIAGFVWIKPPGESDGDYPAATHTHGDPHCDPAGTNTDGNGATYSTGSIPGYDIPAGQWFPAEFQMLAANAYPALP